MMQSPKFLSSAIKSLFSQCNPCFSLLERSYFWFLLHLFRPYCRVNLLNSFCWKSVSWYHSELDCGNKGTVIDSYLENCRRIILLRALSVASLVSFFSNPLGRGTNSILLCSSSVTYL